MVYMKDIELESLLEKVYKGDKGSLAELERMASKSLEAEYQLGHIYDTGAGVNRDYVKAARFMYSAANKGNLKAQLDIAHMYLYGEGVKEDHKEAFDWFLKAALQGSEFAQGQLYRMYAEGDGVEKNIEEAQKWLRKATYKKDVKEFEEYKLAAEIGSAYAQFELGNMWAEGRGVPECNPSPRIAADWFFKAGISYIEQMEKENALRCLDKIDAITPNSLLSKKLSEKIYESVNGKNL